MIIIMSYTFFIIEKPKFGQKVAKVFLTLTLPPSDNILSPLKW